MAGILTRHEIEPPEDDDLESYAELLDLNVQQAFRTPYLMHRLVERKHDDVVNRTADLEPLLARNEVIFVDGGISEALDWGGISEDERRRLETSLREMNRFANTYRHLGIADILNDRSLGVPEKQRAIRGKRQLLQTFHSSNPDLDLEWVNFFDAGAGIGRAFRPKWTGIAEEDRPQVRRTMMAFQRAQSLTASFSETEALLVAGLDSGIAILKLSENEFASRAKLPQAAVQRIYRKAGDRALLTGHALSLIEESTTHASFVPDVFKDESGDSNLDFINVLKDIDGYQDLFGNQNYCHCKHCRSIFGPAAYFVDLMDFIDQNVSQAVFAEKDKTDHPLYLKNRRSDLWTLVLSCKNTDTRIPYLTIVNEVLERYLQRVFEEDDIYEALTQARLSFHQPFNLPFQALLLHLGHFQISLSELYELFALPAADLARARLGCAPEELATIVSPNIDDVLLRYDIPPTGRPLDVASIVKRSGFSREELGRLVDLDFIRGGLLLELKVESETGDLVGFDEKMSIRTGANDKVLTADNAFVRHFLDRLHRFRRLGRRLPWGPEELHLVLTSPIDPAVLANVSSGNTVARTATLGQALNEETVIHIADLRLIQDAFGVSVEELFALYHEIPRLPVAPDKASLFVRLFGEVDSLRIQHPALGNTDPDNAIVSPDFGLLQGALRLSEAQVLELLPIVITPQVIQKRVLNHEQLSALYRHAGLARFMRLGPTALARVADLLNMLRLVQRPAERLPHILRLLAFKEALNETPFSVNDVLWMVAGQVSDGTGPQVNQAQVEGLLERIREDPLLFFTPDSLVEIEGVSLVQAQALVAILAQEPLNWLVRADAPQERYGVTPAYGLNPDLEPVVAFFVAAGDSPDEAARKADDVQRQLDRHHPHAIFITHLTEQFNINQAYFEALRPFLATDPGDEAFLNLLFSWLEPPNGADTQALLELMQALEKLLYLVQEKLDLPVQSLDFVATNPPIFALTLPFTLQWDSLRLLSIYKAFLPAAPEEATQLHQALTSWTGEEFPEGSWPLLVKALKTDLVQIQSLLGNLSVPAAPVDALVTLKNALKLTSKLGLNGAALKQLTARDYAGLKAANGLVYGAIRAKYEEKEWTQVIEPYEDKLNETKRDALVDRILSKEFQLKFSDPRELYQFFLLDVEMDGCARTSRVLEAISACQLYVHRCRMNLEQSESGNEQSESGNVHVQPDRIPADEWLWRKNYRVWEANRKVFLYPENWLEPDLRDNKTPIFKQAESELLQSTITPDAIEKIYRNYLREYAELAQLIVVSTVYDDNEAAYLFFARTPGKPFQYYWRKLLRNVEWTPWEKIDLEIEPPIVSGHKHHGKLYLFWIRVLTNNDKDQGQSSKTIIEDNQTVYLEYSTIEANGRWTTPHRVPFHTIKVIAGDETLDLNDFSQAARNPDEDPDAFSGLSKTPLEVAPYYGKVYVDTVSNDDRIRTFHKFAEDQDVAVVSGHLDEHANAVQREDLAWGVDDSFHFMWADVLKVRDLASSPTACLFVSLNPDGDYFGEVAYEEALMGGPLLNSRKVTHDFPESLDPRLHIVHNRVGDALLSIGNQQFFVRDIGGVGYSQVTETDLVIGKIDAWQDAIARKLRKRDTIRLSTTLADKLGEVLFNQGLESFLSLDTQEFDEARVPSVSFEWISELMPPMDTQGHLNFKGAQGPYFQELFLHLPFLIAHYLNASQKFADADYWYRRIFDPTASENPEPTNPTDRNWRYIEFRNRKVPRLRVILTDEDAIERYKEDPFNPFAIARLRILAFQKSIVMRYVDNLLDWGDHLFAQDTFESINEATMLYIMAADILGDRPLELGDCETVSEFLLTYQNILSHKGAGSEFLIELENLYVILAYLNFDAPEPLNGEDNDTDSDNTSAGFVALRARSAEFKPYHLVKSTMKEASPLPPALPKQYTVAAKSSADTAVHRSLAFCIPPNDTLLGYWDRVEDRLFKIRNCMNLQGVRRELALFQPPIDPGLLVRAKAAGLSLEDVLGLLTAEMPAYRFTYLLEKAKQFAATAQGFGSALLSALEKKDSEELTLIRSVHEQELLKAIRIAKDQSLLEANHNESALEASRTLAIQRKTHYTDLLNNAFDPVLAISKYEQDDLDNQEEAKDSDNKASKREQGASGINAAPSIGFSVTPFEFKLPFHPMAQTPLTSSVQPFTFSHSTAMVASSLSASASKFRSDGSFRNIEARKSATRGGYERRKEEWLHQKELAELEEKQLDKQLLASRVRVALAQNDKDAHDKQIEQSAEVHEFYRDKLTGLGLYTYLASSLSRLYREAYNLAHDMAMRAQRAYQFETDDQTFFVGNDNWQADKAGLLAGERLTLQLQQMDKAYLEQTRREYEITLPCSLVQMNPRALIDLRETASCDFSIPEIWFDLYYPGQYKRRIKSVRLTMPCITGPYTNVSAKLTLTGSRMRLEPQLNSELIGIPHQRNTSVATSTANSDAGVFELNFRDERYVPFEGAGAVSDWHLELPSVFRPFDYDSISDVILHISYVAKDDGRFKEEVEDDLANRFVQLAAETGLERWFSMKREFGTALHRLRHPSQGSTPATEITLDKRYFPHFLRNRNITLEQATLILKPTEGEVLEIDDLDLRLNNSGGGVWSPFPNPEGQLRAKAFALGEPLNSAGNRWTITINQGELSLVEDIWIMVAYAI